MSFAQTPVSLDALTRHPRFAERANSYVRWYPKNLNSGFDQLTAIPDKAWVDGVYIHVPFCDVICRFCPFNKVPSKPYLVDQFVRALCAEVKLYATRLAFNDVRFIYLGGGTPSVLSASELELVFTALGHAGVRLDSCEISLEVHPKHLQPARLADWKRLGVNRISSGIQAFTDRELQLLGSHHSQTDVELGLAALYDTFPNYAIDLLYRFGGQTVDDWARTLDTVIKRGVPHISAYALVGPELPTVPERLLEAEMAVLLDSQLTKAGYRHYASCASGGYDYCIPGKEGLYESAHWGAPQATYVGLGPGAFGFIGGATTVNGLGIDAYCDSVRNGELPLASVEHASDEELRHRFFVLGVKTLEVSLSQYKRHFQEEISAPLRNVIQTLERDGFVAVANDRLVVTSLGRHYVDEISAAFFSLAQAQVVHPEEPEIRRAELARRNAVRLSL